jgi:hypothetical protein
MAINMGSSTTTSPHRRNADLTGLSGQEATLRDNLLKLRSVLILLAAHRGSKLEMARSLATELQAKSLKASVRSLYFWRGNYLRAGFAGIARRRRSDRSQPQCFSAEILARIVDIATRVRRHGDLSREFRSGGFRDYMCFESFRTWIRAVQRQLRVAEMPTREGRPIALSR